MEEKTESGKCGKKQNFLCTLVSKVKNMIQDGTDRQEHCRKCGKCFGCCRPVKCEYFYHESCDT